ncbi:MAG: hypothetical protein FJ404_15305 [Verrucomicrobia bacterium]|nr:hypothetical protein [Verrucomicrobiota bacterium]
MKTWFEKRGIVLCVWLGCGVGLAAVLRAGPSLDVAMTFGGGGRGYLEDSIHAIVVDSSGRPSVAGYTTSPNFPWTQKRYQPPGGRAGFICGPVFRGRFAFGIQHDDTRVLSVRVGAGFRGPVLGGGEVVW